MSKRLRDGEITPIHSEDKIWWQGNKNGCPAITKCMLTAALLTAKKCKQPKGASSDEWTRVLAHSGAHLTIKRNGALTYAITQMNPENIKWKKLVKKDRTLCDSLYMNYSEWATLSRQEVAGGCLRLGARAKDFFSGWWKCSTWWQW